MTLRGKILYFISVVLVSAGIFLVYLPISRVGTDNATSLPNMLEGRANRPAAYRILMPLLAHLGASSVPDWIVRAFQNASPGLSAAFQLFSNNKYPREAIVILTLMFLSLAGLIFIEKYFLRVLGYTRNEQLILPFVIAILILPFTVHFGYIYDLPQIFLFTCCLVLMHRQRWITYLALLGIATLNKETSVFLIVVFALYFFRALRFRAYLLLLTLQGAIFLSIRAITTYLYRNNPGNTLPWTIQFHIDQYSSHPAILVFTMIFLSAIIFFAMKDWGRKPIFLRYSFSVFFLTLALFFTSGMPMEFRVFLDSLPVFGILLSPHGKPGQVVVDL